MSSSWEKNAQPQRSAPDADGGEAFAETDCEHAEASMKCPRCGYAFITKVDGKRKLRTRVLIFGKNGKTMGICPRCKTHLRVPVVLKE